MGKYSLYHGFIRNENANAINLPLPLAKIPSFSGGGRERVGPAPLFKDYERRDVAQRQVRVDI
jgi:hypothetical protein